MTGAGQSPRLPATPVAFPSIADLERRSSEAQRRQLAAWREAARQWNGDPDLLLRFDFESIAASRALPNLAARRESVGDGTIVGCEQTKGRWPGKGALGFHSVSHRVRIHVPGRLRSVTLSAWVRVDGLDRTFNSLVMSQGYDAGAVHWQINQKGVAHVGVRGAHKSSTHDDGTPLVFTPDRFGRWTHLALVFDAAARRVTHFVDGVPASRLEFLAEVPLQIGYADAGSWNVGTHSTIYPVRHFSGRMDELLLFRRALSDAEIEQIYSTGVALALADYYLRIQEPEGFWHYAHVVKPDGTARRLEMSEAKGRAVCRIQDAHQTGCFRLMLYAWRVTGEQKAIRSMWPACCGWANGFATRSLARARSAAGASSTDWTMNRPPHAISSPR